MSNSKSSGKSKGYAFTFEAAMALLLVLGFLGIAIIYPQQKESYTSIIESKELVVDTQRALDENGFIVNLLDQDLMSDSDKMAALYAMLESTLPATLDMRISLKKFDANADDVDCLLTETFEKCFPAYAAFPDKGSTLPNDREIAGNTFFMVKKSSPGQCDILDILAPEKEKSKLPIAFFGGPTAYFADANDLNIVFSTKVTPATEAECDQDITVDLNATIPPLGRSPADIMLVLDRSGSMAEFTALLAQFSGSLGNGTITTTDLNSTGSLGGGTISTHGHDSQFNNWVSLRTFSITDLNEFGVRMTWAGSGGTGEHKPKLYIENPHGTDYGFYGGAPPGGTYTSTDLLEYVMVPASVSHNGTWTVWGWNDETAVTYSLGISIRKSLENWQNIGSFIIEDENGFIVDMNWLGSCSGNCPELYIRSPTGIKYGYYGGIPPGGGSAYTSTSSRNTITATRAELGTWTIFEWNDNPAVTQTTTVYLRKIDAVQIASKKFVNFTSWQDQDKIGLVSFSSSPSNPIDQTLDANKQKLIPKLNSMESNGMTAIFDSICAATRELISVRGRTSAYKFQVLLSDGQSNNDSNHYCDYNYGAAYDAKKYGIKIYTIGFGGGADEATLRKIAGITDGNYYFASDENVLKEVYDMIAQEIGDILAEGQAKAYGANVAVQLPKSAVVSNPGTGNWIPGADPNFINYNIGDMNAATPWLGHFVMHIPCNDDTACATTSIRVPDENSYFTYYKDQNHAGGEKAIKWDGNTILFRYRDLQVNILAGRLFGSNRMALDLNAANTGTLSSNTATTIALYWSADSNSLDDPLGSLTVPLLLPGQAQAYYDVNIAKAGWIIAIINPDPPHNINECPQGNIAKIKCTSGTKVEYYQLKVQIWRR